MVRFEYDDLCDGKFIMRSVGCSIVKFNTRKDMEYEILRKKKQELERRMVEKVQNRIGSFQLPNFEKSYTFGKRKSERSVVTPAKEEMFIRRRPAPKSQYVIRKPVQASPIMIQSRVNRVEYKQQKPLRRVEYKEQKPLRRIEYKEQKPLRRIEYKQQKPIRKTEYIVHQPMRKSEVVNSRPLRRNEYMVRDMVKTVGGGIQRPPKRYQLWVA